MMSKLWREQKHPAPRFNNDRSHKAFEIYLPGLDVDLDGTSKLMGPLVEKGRKAQLAGELAGEVLALLNSMEGAAMHRTKMQQALGLKALANFRERYLLPALSAGLIEMTIQDKPNSRLRRYRVTEKGKDCLRATNPASFGQWKRA